MMETVIDSLCFQTTIKSKWSSGSFPPVLLGSLWPLRLDCGSVLKIYSFREIVNRLQIQSISILTMRKMNA